MSGRRAIPDLSDREDFTAAPVNPPSPAAGPAMQDPGWVEMFLGQNSDAPFRVTNRLPGNRHRSYRRKSLRRG